jgi:CHAT domain-containing protein
MSYSCRQGPFFAAAAIPLLIVGGLWIHSVFPAVANVSEGGNASGRASQAEFNAQSARKIDSLVTAQLSSRQLAETMPMVKRFEALLDEGDDAAARVEAQRIERSLSKYFKDENYNYAIMLSYLGDMYRYRLRFKDAEGYYKKLATEYKRKGEENSRDYALAINYVAVMCEDQGKYNEAEIHYQHSLKVREDNFGADHPIVANALNNLAGLYQSKGRYADAEQIYQRALKINEKVNDELGVATVLNNLAANYPGIEIPEKEGGPLRRALAIRTRLLGEDHHLTTTSINNLGFWYQSQGDYKEALKRYAQALEIKKRLLGENHPSIATTMGNLAAVHALNGNHEEAERLHLQAWRIDEKILGPDHPDAAPNALNLASFYRKRNDTSKALLWSRKAIKVSVDHAAAEALSQAPAVRASEMSEQTQSHKKRFLDHVAILAAAARNEPETEPALSREAFQVAQWATHSSAGAAVQQMGLRFASNNSSLAMMVRESQDLVAFLRERDAALVQAISKVQGQVDSVLIGTIRRQISDAQRKLSISSMQLEKEFPDFVNLANPKPATVEAVQKRLGDNQALLFFLTGEGESYLFALTGDDFIWRTIPFGTNAISQKVADFRQGLDIEKFKKSIDTGTPVLFNLALANELYQTLVGPAEALVGGSRHLLVVASGALTALPFHLLVTGKPAASTAPAGDQGDAIKPQPYQDAAWLIKSHTVAVLPSVGSLQTLDGSSDKGRANKAMIGFGDPVFDPSERTKALETRRLAMNRAPVNNLAYSGLWQGLDIDRTRLAQSLRSLLDTADELKAVAAALGVDASDLYLEGRANESAVKRARLIDYRIVYFATHGLVAGDVKGMGEPALVLSLPKEPTDFDDGLLTASEVAQLKLNADWVVLSACNTIAGGKPDAEALSGLARAFFYAGARGLLVSHWSVDSAAAVRLTTSMFNMMRSDPGLDRTESIQRAMIAFMQDRSNPWYAYPAYWGPFSLVGRGRGW